MEVPKTSTTLRFALLLTAAGGFLDAYTYISRGGVFANAQTGNVILMAIDLSERHFHAARAHLWPILAFIVGVAFAHLLKGELAHSVFDHPIRIAMVAQIVVLVAVAFVPANVPNAAVTVPISFVAAMQFGLFRTIGSLSYIAVATTGNLMRFTESAYAGYIEKVPESRQDTRVYAAIVGSFAGGAVLGAYATRYFGGAAAWIPAALLCGALVLFYIDDRRRRRL